MSKQYTVDELMALRAKWWVRACDEERITMIRHVIRELGQPLEGGLDHSGRELTHGPLKFSGQMVGRDFTVTLLGRLVAGEWEEFQLYVPGWWESEVEKLHAKACEIANRRASEAQEEDRQRLTRELWLDTPLTERQPTHN